MNALLTGRVTILCSGFGLGFYIPGVLVGEKLRRLKVDTDIEVFESLMAEPKIAMVEKNREAYRRSFRLALTSQKVPGDSRHSLDSAAMASLLAKWHGDRRQHFICLSGHWVHVLETYRQIAPDNTISVDLLYVDADLSPSWRWLAKLKRDYAAPYKEGRLYDLQRSEVTQTIDTNLGSPLPYSRRHKRLVVHGGGWGIGTFQERIPSIEAAGFDLDIVCYKPSEVSSPVGGRRHFMDDPTWRTWHRNQDGQHTFPPFGEVGESGSFDFLPQQHCHGLHRIIRQARGIVSKPGAGTLIDSFASATPLIMLEPFGPHEERNAHIWEISGFGIPYNKWARAGYSVAMLADLHSNLIARRESVPDYAEQYVRAMGRLMEPI